MKAIVLTLGTGFAQPATNAITSSRATPNANATLMVFFMETSCDYQRMVDNHKLECKGCAKKRFLAGMRSSPCIARQCTEVEKPHLARPVRELDTQISISWIHPDSLRGQFRLWRAPYNARIVYCPPE